MFTYTLNIGAGILDFNYIYTYIFDKVPTTDAYKVLSHLTKILSLIYEIHIYIYMYYIVCIHIHIICA